MGELFVKELNQAELDAFTSFTHINEFMKSPINKILPHELFISLPYDVRRELILRTKSPHNYMEMMGLHDGGALYLDEEYKINPNEDFSLHLRLSNIFTISLRPPKFNKIEFDKVYLNLMKNDLRLIIEFSEIFEKALKNRFDLLQMLLIKVKMELSESFGDIPINIDTDSVDWVTVYKLCNTFNKDHAIIMKNILD